MIRCLKLQKITIKKVEGLEEMDKRVIVYFIMKNKIEKYTIIFKVILILNKIIKIPKTKILMI